MSPDTALPPHVGLVTGRLPDGVALVRLSGEIDIEWGPIVCQAVEHASLEVSGVVADLSGVTLLSASGFRAVAEAAAELAGQGKRLDDLCEGVSCQDGRLRA